MLKHLLDTHIAIYVIKRRPIEVLGVFNENAGRMALWAITLSELFHGAEKSARVAQNLAVVEEFASLLAVLPCTAKASMHYGTIRSALEKAGRPIGVDDLHIAAHARGTGLTLVPNNTSEFERVPGLVLQNWVDGLTLLATLAGLARAQPGPARLPEVGACPSGYAARGDYCLSTR